MARKTDIVSLKWVTGLVNKQAENAEAALVEYSKDASQKKALLKCMWSVHQITSTLRALGIKKGEMLTIEMERSLNFLYKDKVLGERRKLTMGGLMQALKILPAYLAHVQSVRQDTGQGLEQYVNDLRRWVGERPRPQAFFFHMEIPEGAGISADARPAADEEIMSRANVMLALYLEMAKSALRKRNTAESMKTVARISRKMQTLFAGTEQERFWFTLIGICEGMAGGIIVPDECIAQIFKSGAFMIKHARENGSELDPSMDYADYLQQMLYYIAACRAKPVHIANIRESFGVDDDTVAASRRGLVHIDALVTALSSALEQLNGVIDFITGLKVDDPECFGPDIDGNEALDGIEAAQARLRAAGQDAHADSLQAVHVKVRNLFGQKYGKDVQKLEQAVTAIVRGVVDVKLDLEYKLEHGVCSSFYSKEFELRESVVNATFSQMSLVENNLHTILRRKSLAAALKTKPTDVGEQLTLTMALHRYLNKTDQGLDELRSAVAAVDRGEGDIDHLFQLATEFLKLRQKNENSDRQAIAASIQLLAEISGALTFAGLEREGEVIEKCRLWLENASKAGSVREDEAFTCFAEAFAQLELHLQRTIIDPLDDTSHMMALAEQRAEKLDAFAKSLSAGADVVVPETSRPQQYVQDAEIPAAFREAFVEESEELSGALAALYPQWQSVPDDDHVMREIRRHFHTFKGNGRAVGANILGELGWAAQDLMDRVLDGDLQASDKLMGLVEEVIDGLPGLVGSYRDDKGLDVDCARDLTNRCFRMASCAGENLAEELTGAEGSVVPIRPESESTASTEPLGQ
ncbi:MAG: Hpt domain-containing protein [Pseudomonadota bacterium]